MFTIGVVLAVGIGGLFVGGAVGFFVAAMCAVAGQANDGWQE